MLEVTCYIDCTSNERNNKLLVQSVWTDNRCIKLFIGGQEYIVNATDLCMAITNAINH